MRDKKKFLIIILLVFLLIFFFSCVKQDPRTMFNHLIQELSASTLNKIFLPQQHRKKKIKAGKIFTGFHVVANDLDGDGFIDFIVHLRQMQTMRAFLYNGTFLWERPYWYALPDGSHEITTVIEDFNEDGKNEVAVLEHEKNDLYLRFRP